MLPLKQLMFVLAILFTSIAYGQTIPAIYREQWNATPAIHKVTEEQSKEPAVVISDKRRIEYIDVDGEQVQYRTLHKIVHLNDDRGIEAFNKIYLPVIENKSIVDIKARTILPGGRIIELDKQDIKEIKEDDNLYKIFAMEGLVKGCEIEFLYTYSTNVSFFGRELIQGNHLVLKGEVEIVAPERLVFETRTFNGTCAKKESTADGKNIISVELSDVAAADDEKYSMVTANLKRVEYKLSYNKSRSASERLFTWNELAKNVYRLNSQFTEKELKKMNSVVESNGWKKLPGDKEKVIAVENYFKKTFATREDIYTDEAENIEWILKNKICSHRGMNRLFSSAFQILGVNHEHVLCGSRENFAIDKGFENWINCDNSLIYIPALQNYLAPTSADMRFPWFNATWAGTDGIFCKPTTIGTFNTAIGYVKQIKMETPEANQSNIEARVHFNSSLDTLVVDAKNVHTGYVTGIFRRIFNYNSEDEQKDIIKSMIKQNLGTEKILSSKIENKEFEKMTSNEPFVLQATVQAPGMIERAGNRVLVKVGELIGPQAEMYQEKKRMFPIEIEYPHIMARKITLEIPAGYRIRNIEDLKINNVVKDAGELTMGFESNAELSGNMLTINIVEQYRKVLYTMDQYVPFRGVINAAADFNKVVLVLEKI
jgi:hypothetical protein